MRFKLMRGIFAAFALALSMNSFMKKALSVSFAFGLIIIMGVFAVLADSNESAGMYIPDIEISVHSPIMDMIGHEITVDTQSLSAFLALNTARIQSFDINHTPCEDIIAAHQDRIDNILNLIFEHDIDNLQDLSVILQTLQSEGDYTTTIESACSSGCVLIPGWVVINGARIPALVCKICGRIFLVS
jgi:hypothetical protein